MSSTDQSAVSSWFSGRLLDAWATTAAADVVVDREEITVTLILDAPATSEEASDIEIAEQIDGRIAAFRADTKEQRIEIASEAEHRFDRKVSWAVTVADRTVLFTHLAVPVMTRLRQPERQVIDTLVASNVARSRADAVAWCVRLVGEHTDDWIRALQDALRTVDSVRTQGPDAA